MNSKMIKTIVILGALGAFWILGDSDSEARSKGDPVVEFAASDLTMNDAQAEAQRTLPKFFEASLDPAGEAQRDTLVKVAFPVENAATPDMKVEVIWVGPFRKHGDSFVGSLANEPVSMPGFHAGSEVEFSEDMIRDWIMPGPDGRAFGHYTTRVIAFQSEDTQFKSMIAQMLMPNPAPDGW